MELRVFTLNCWGIPYVSKDRKARMKAISELFAQNKFDIVCLQEVWSEDDFKMISKVAHEALPFGHYFHSGVLGSGICILSKYCIKATFFHQWAVNGYIHKIQHGDWFGGKGVGLCRIQVGEFLINVYSAHLHAEYNRNSNDYRVHRVLQAFDTAQFIRLTSGDANGVILAGDLNTEPEDLEYRLLLKCCGLEDSFLVESTSTNLGYRGTNECARNSYSDRNATKDCPEGQRIDYILFRAGTKTKCQLTDYSLPLPTRVPSQNFSYSDHEGVQANLVFSVDAEEDELVGEGKETSIVGGSSDIRNRFDNTRRIHYSVSHDESNSSDLQAALKEGTAVCEKYLDNLSFRRKCYLLISCLLFICILATSVPDIPAYYKVPVLILNIFLSFCSFFFFLMGVLWNSIERNATVAGIATMRIFTEYVTNKCKEDQYDNV